MWYTILQLRCQCRVEEWGDPLFNFCKKGVGTMAGNRTAEKVRELVENTVESLGLVLWDVRFVKEGASWYLRIYIDKEGGVSIDDCTDVSHLVDPILDEADPIETSYYLEVCSPGLGRELRTEEHFKAFIGQKAQVTLYRAQNGCKVFTGIINGFTNGPVIAVGDEEMSFALQDIAKAKLCDDEFDEF